MKSSKELSTAACNLTGFIHSIETFGTVDGPGIRLVVFFQGCPMRCLYCHNPDTWEPRKGQKMTADEILSLYEKNRNYYKNGGITATGGEPLLQINFLTELFGKAKKRGIHTCLDTSGILYKNSHFSAFDTLFSFTDLILLDLKHSDPSTHKTLTGHSSEAVLEFLDKTSKARIPVIIRHVLVSGITDSTAQLEGIGRIIAAHPNVTGVEVLPYHNMGEKKYEELQIPYPLKGMETMRNEEAVKARKTILESAVKYYL